MRDFVIIISVILIIAFGIYTLCVCLSEDYNDKYWEQIEKEE